MALGAAVAEQRANATATDAGLVAASLGAGGAGAFGELVGRYKGMVMGRILSIVADRHEAEDLAQDAFVRAYRSLAQLQKPSDFGAWLGRIARNVALTAARKRRPASLDGLAAKDDAPAERVIPSDRAADPGVSAERRELYERALRTVESLPEEYRSTVYLRYLKGRSCREIAEIEGIPTGTVTSRLARAGEMLRERLAPVARGGE